MSNAALAQRLRQMDRVRRGLPAEVAPAPAAPVLRADVFHGADFNRLLMDWIASALSPDDEIKGSLKTLRARARELRRNTPLVRQYTNLLTANVVGPTGFKLRPRARLGGNPMADLDRAANEAITVAWDRWGERVTLDGRLDLVEAEQLALRTLAIDGECFIRKIRGTPANDFRFALQFIDADLVDETYNRAGGRADREIRMGVEIDPETGGPAGYWVKREASGAGRYFVPADEMIHLYLCDRPNQTRGVSWLSASMVVIKMLRDYAEAELVGARMGASNMGWIEQKEGATPGSLGGDEKKPMYMDMAPGEIHQLPAGWTFNGWSPDHPTTAFEPFTKAMTRDIATGLAMSYNALANDLEGVNYSSMRSGLLIERDSWRVMQGWLKSHLISPIHYEFLSMALLSGQLPLPDRDPRRYCDAKWIGRGWQWVDPLREAQAAVLAIDNALATRTGVLAEQGVDLEDLLEERREEERLAREYGVELHSPAAAQAMAQAQALTAGDSADEDDSEDGNANGNGRGGAAGASRQGAGRALARLATGFSRNGR